MLSINWSSGALLSTAVFSRLPVFLSCSTNNTAATVYSLFIKAVQGSENVDVVK